MGFSMLAFLVLAMHGNGQVLWTAQRAPTRWGIYVYPLDPFYNMSRHGNHDIMDFCHRTLWGMFRLEHLFPHYLQRVRNPDPETARFFLVPHIATCVVEWIHSDALRGYFCLAA
jgi:hypothetical protein